MTQFKCMGNFITNKKNPDFNAKFLKHEITRLYLKLKIIRSFWLEKWLSEKKYQQIWSNELFFKNLHEISLKICQSKIRSN